MENDSKKILYFHISTHVLHTRNCEQQKVPTNNHTLWNFFFWKSNNKQQRTVTLEWSYCTMKGKNNIFLYCYLGFYWLFFLYNTRIILRKHWYLVIKRNLLWYSREWQTVIKSLSCDHGLLNMTSLGFHRKHICRWSTYHMSLNYFSHILEILFFQR